MYNHFSAASVSESPFLQDLRVGLKSGWFPGKRDMNKFAPFEKKKADKKKIFDWLLKQSQRISCQIGKH